MKRVIFSMVILVALVFVVVACTTPAATTQAPAATNATVATSASAAGDKLYVFLPKGLDNPYWDNCRKGMEAEMAKKGVHAEFIGPAKSDAAAQVAIFEQVIARKPVAIAVSPNDPATVKESIAKATAAGIKVITWDADAPDSERLLYIGTDNTAAGATAGETLAKAIGNKGKIAILTGSLSALNAQQRVTGFKQAIAKYPDIKIVAEEATEDDLATALSKAEAILQANPDLVGFYGVTGSGVPGASGAVKQANKCATVKVVGFDVIPQGIEFMKAGCVAALISQRPYGMTAQALDIMIDLANGGAVTSKSIDTGVEVVYPEGLDTYLKTDH